MSFAENLQYLRKRKNITQEQLAEELEVSRQSVSKWESAQSYPEMEKLLQICRMFHCSMDALVQGDVSREFAEDVHGYDRFQNQFSIWVSAGVGLILLGLSVMMALSETAVGEMVSVEIFFVFLIIAVLILVVKGMEYSHFQNKHPQVEDFYTEEQKERAVKTFTVRVAAGIGIILVAVLFFMIAGDRIERISDTAGKEQAESMAEGAFTNDTAEKEQTESMAGGAYISDTAEKEQAESMAGGVFMLAITAAVSLLVYGGMQKSKYDIEAYNREANPSPETKRRNILKGKICGCIMLVATIVFLTLGFTGNYWASAGLIYAVAGILCGIAAIAVSKAEE